MESLAAFFAAATIVACLKGARRACGILFAFALGLVAWLLHAHATDSLPLDF